MAIFRIAEINMLFGTDGVIVSSLALDEDSERGWCFVSEVEDFETRDRFPIPLEVILIDDDRDELLVVFDFDGLHFGLPFEVCVSSGGRSRELVTGRGAFRAYHKNRVLGKQQLWSVNSLQY